VDGEKLDASARNILTNIDNGNITGISGDGSLIVNNYEGTNLDPDNKYDQAISYFTRLVV